MTDPRSDVTALLKAISTGDCDATDDLLPLVYQELRAMARVRMARERPGNTLSPTALVHEAYLRLLGGGESSWSERGHFFAAAAEAMRRILIERARRRSALKRGGGDVRQAFTGSLEVAAEEPDPDELLALNIALERLEVVQPKLAHVVKLRYFAGLSIEETAAAIGDSRRTVARQWAAARAWLAVAMDGSRPARSATATG